MSDVGVFDLDSFAPKPIRFKLRETVYEISGDPDVDLVAMMLRLEPLLHTAHGLGDELPAELGDAIVEAKEILLDLIEERQQVDRDTFRIGAGELVILFARMTGSETVAQAVAEAITSAQRGENGDGAPSEAEPVGADGEDGAAATPTRSARRSSARSSRSASRGNGRRTTTGT